MCKFDVKKMRNCGHFQPQSFTPEKLGEKLVNNYNLYMQEAVVHSPNGGACYWSRLRHPPPSMVYFILFYFL